MTSATKQTLGIPASLSRLRRGVGRRLAAPFLQAGLAGRFDPGSAIALTSTPRSGSTWLGDALGAIPQSCVLFEPLQLEAVPRARQAGFTWRTCLRPEDQWPEGEAFLRQVFEGRVINAWTGREMRLPDALRARTMIVKFVRANRLLPWLCHTFDMRGVVLLARHPCAVVASQLRSPDWQRVPRPTLPPSHPELSSLEPILAATSHPEEFLAASWALDLLIPLRTPPPRPWTTVTYEELVLAPRETMEHLRSALALDLDVDRALVRMQRPSSMVYQSGISSIDGWTRQLDDGQIRRILDVVHRLGVPMYGRDPEPDLATLRSAFRTEVP